MRCDSVLTSVHADSQQVEQHGVRGDAGQRVQVVLQARHVHLGFSDWWEGWGEEGDEGKSEEGRRVRKGRRGMGKREEGRRWVGEEGDEGKREGERRGGRKEEES